MGLTLVTPPTADPVSLEEAKAQVRVQHDDEDAYIASLITAATRHVERTLGISLMERTYKLTLDAFADAIEMPRGPVSSVTSVQYVDADGATQTVATDAYSTDLISAPRQWLVRNIGATWPTTIDAVNAVSVTYVAGYDELPAELADLKHAILIGIQRLYERHADPKNEEAMVSAIDALVQPHRMVMV